MNKEKHLTETLNHDLMDENDRIRIKLYMEELIKNKEVKKITKKQKDLTGEEIEELVCQETCTWKISHARGGYIDIKTACGLETKVWIPADGMGTIQRTKTCPCGKKMIRNELK